MCRPPWFMPCSVFRTGAAHTVSISYLPVWTELWQAYRGGLPCVCFQIRVTCLLRSDKRALKTDLLSECPWVSSVSHSESQENSGRTKATVLRGARVLCWLPKSPQGEEEQGATLTAQSGCSSPLEAATCWTLGHERTGALDSGLGMPGGMRRSDSWHSVHRGSALCTTGRTF